jgi:YHS domain-containing protein
MRSLFVVLSLVLSVGCASTKSAEGPTATAAALKKPGEAALGDRTTCPVSGEVFTVASDSPKVEFEGKTYFFCCNDCVADFQKDPAKYIAKFSGP